jgi:hypothetical protein
MRGPENNLHLYVAYANEAASVLLAAKRLSGEVGRCAMRALYVFDELEACVKALEQRYGAGGNKNCQSREN